MLVLAIDTALSACSAALWRDGEAVAARVEPMAKGQAERLAPLVQELLAEAGVTAGALDRIAVTTGPGAFTGVRIGLSFARAFALALGRPAVGLSTLEVLAAGAAVQKAVPVIAVAGSVFAAAIEGRRVVAVPQRVPDLAAFLAPLGEGWSLTGPGIAALSDLRPDWPVIAQEVPDPMVLAGLAAFCDPAAHPATPLYLRGADAKLPGGRAVPDLTGLADFRP